MSAVKSEIVDIAGVHCGSVGLLSYGQGWSFPPLTEYEFESRTVFIYFHFKGFHSSPM